MFAESKTKTKKNTPKDRNGQKQTESDRNVQKRTEMDRKLQERTGTDKNRQKLTKLIEKDRGGERRKIFNKTRRGRPC